MRTIPDAIGAAETAIAGIMATITIGITIVFTTIIPLNQLRKPHAAQKQDDKRFRTNNLMHRIYSLILAVDLLKLHFFTNHNVVCSRMNDAPLPCVQCAWIAVWSVVHCNCHRFRFHRACSSSSLFEFNPKQNVHFIK